LSSEGLELLGNPSIDLQDDYGRTPAFAAISSSALADFLDAGANPNAINSFGMTLLGYKAASGPTPSAEILLRRSDVTLPHPTRDKAFQDILNAAYMLQVSNRFQELVDLAHWGQLMKLLDNIAKSIRYAKKSNSELDKLPWHLQAFGVAALSAMAKNHQSVYNDTAIYLWDIFECNIHDPIFKNAIECLLRAGVPSSWGEPGQPPRRRSNVLIRACELKAYDFIPKILSYVPV
jgi:hypothetical protein